MGVCLQNPRTTTWLAENIPKHEVPTPATDGAQVVFTVANAYQSGSLEVYRDQSTLINPADFAETTSTTFTVTSAPAADEGLTVSYIKQ